MALQSAAAGLVVNASIMIVLGTEGRSHGLPSCHVLRKTGIPPAYGMVTVASVDVTFTKVAGCRYLMTIVRERGPQLASRHGPGYDDYLPHDAVHFIVEAEARLPLPVRKGPALVGGAGRY
jgi:hypothetical protein